MARRRLEYLIDERENDSDEEYGQDDVQVAKERATYFEDYDDSDFVTHFRLSKTSALSVLSMIEHNLEFTTNRTHFDIGCHARIPTRNTILRWVASFRITGSTLKKKSPGRNSIALRLSEATVRSRALRLLSLGPFEGSGTLTVTPQRWIIIILRETNGELQHIRTKLTPQDPTAKFHEVGLLINSFITAEEGANRTIPLFWLDGRHVDMRPAVSWSVWAVKGP
ncbi:hypothetical protein ANN_02529 [Periplaneta americana]|uniref:DUF4817 domain-containing protein n=1 Tax=Periplaneta americana TaxID=6978 RepID=A0ABQ8TWI9_PERAM|nr:hypothetical protein ANN_02529 [Periplaneta americana]